MSLLSLVLAAAHFVALPVDDGFLSGAWSNPAGSVEVQIDHCGTKLCGTVIAASGAAIGDSRDAGYPQLVGMQLMRDYHPDGPGRWSGTVFVPDLGHSFSSHIVTVDQNHVRVSGCLIGSFLCRSQLWRRS